MEIYFFFIKQKKFFRGCQNFCSEILIQNYIVLKTIYTGQKRFCSQVIRNQNLAVNVLAPSEEILFFNMAVLFSKQTCLSFFENFTVGFSS